MKEFNSNLLSCHPWWTIWSIFQNKMNSNQIDSANVPVHPPDQAGRKPLQESFPLPLKVFKHYNHYSLFPSWFLYSTSLHSLQPSRLSSSLSASAFLATLPSSDLDLAFYQRCPPQIWIFSDVALLRFGFGFLATLPSSDFNLHV